MKRTMKARAVVELTAEVDEERAMVAHVASSEMADALAALSTLTCGRIAAVDFRGVRAVRDESGELPGYTSDLDRDDEGIDTAALGGAFDYLFGVIDASAANKARARRELTAIRKAVLS